MLLSMRELFENNFGLVKWICPGLLILMALLVYCLQTLPDGNLHVHVLDIGQGDAILLTTPARERIVIDGGPDDKVIRELSKVMPFYERTIDTVILTHPHADHVNGLVEILKRYRVKQVLMTGVAYSYAGYMAFLAEIHHQKIPILFIDKSDDLQLGTVIFDILFPFTPLEGRSFVNVNNSSIVFRLLYGKNVFYFSGDLEEEKEHELVRKGVDLKSDFFKAGHHGSRTSSTESLLENIKPKYAAISCGVDNKFHHPHPVTIKNFQKRRIKFLRTDIDGTVEIISNGTNIKMSALGK